MLVDAGSVPKFDAYTGRRTFPSRALVRIGENEIGFCMVRADECFRAALATATQIPIDQVFDVRIDERVMAGEDLDQISSDFWDSFEAWLDERGLDAVFHASVPVDCERWIGLIPPPAPGPVERLAALWVAAREGSAAVSTRRRTAAEAEHGEFAGHTLVMSRDRIVFDPSISILTPPGTRPELFQPSDVKSGIEIRTKE